MSVGPQRKPCMRYVECRHMAPPGEDLCTQCAEEYEVKRFGKKPRRQRTRIDQAMIWSKAGMQHPKDVQRKNRAKARAKGRVARKSRKNNR